MSEPITVPVKYIYVDVVKFTLRRSVEAQADIIAILNRIVSEAFELEKVGEERRIYFTAGDGICAAILGSTSDRDEHDIHVGVSLRILSLLSSSNEEVKDDMRRFDVRIGINANVDNIVTDINGNRSLAGPGINGAQRVMNAAGPNQIFVSASVYDTLRHREKYMNSLRHVAKLAKHGETLSVYQLILKDQKGLDIDLPPELLPASAEPLSRLLAYYMMFAIQHQAELLAVPDFKGSMINADAARIMYYLMAADAIGDERAQFNEKPVHRLYKLKDTAFEGLFEHYRAQDTWVVDTAVRYIKMAIQDGFGQYFHDRSCLFVNEAGLAKLGEDHPDLAKRIATPT